MIGVAVPLVALVAVVASCAWLVFLKFNDFRAADRALLAVSDSRYVQHQVHELQQERGQLMLSVATTGGTPRAGEFERYTERIAELNQRHAGVDSIGHPALRESVRALEATGQVKEAAARERGLVTGMLVASTVEPWDYARFSAVRVSREDRLADFDRAASEGQRARLHAALNTPAAAEAARYETVAINGHHVDPTTWWTTMSMVVDDLRAAEQALADDITHHAQQLRQTAVRDLGLFLGLGALATMAEITLLTRRRVPGQVDAVAALVTEIGAKLLDGATADEAWHLVARRMTELTSASCVLILLGANEKMRFAACAGTGAEDLRRLRDAVAGSCLAGAPSSEAPVVIDDLSGHLRETTRAFGPAVAIPIRVGSRAWGMLLAVRGAGAASYVPAEVTRLVTLTDHAAVALGGHADVEDERYRIAQDLYPLVFRRLIAAGMSLQGALGLLPDAPARRRVVSVIDELDETVRQMKAMIFDLELADPTGNLRQRLVDLTVELTTDTTLLLSVSMPRSVDRLVPAEVAEHVEAVVREAVSNVISHAHASELSLEVETTEHVLTVSVQDNGIGFRPDSVRSGLSGLEQRAVSLGGALVIAQLPAGGTRLTWRVPLPHRA